MKTLTKSTKESVHKVLSLCLSAVKANDYNYQTIKAINFCFNAINSRFKHKITDSRYVIISNINLELSKISNICFIDSKISV